MEKRTIREVSYRAWDDERQDERVYSGALALGYEPTGESKVEIFADGESMNIPEKDIPLLIKVLKEFC